MMIRSFVLTLAFAIMSACTHSHPEFRDAPHDQQKEVLKDMTAPQSVKRLIFFGDSFTDSESRLLNHTHGLIPTTAYYWKGRFSNGPVWSDYVSGALALPTINYAMAGARIKEKNSFGVPGNAFKVLEVPGADEQIKKFTDEHGRFRPDDLVFVWFGSNDYLFYADAAAVPTYVQQVTDVTRKMIALGARNLLVFSLIPFDDVPLDPKGVDGQNFDRKQLEALIDQHNSSLRANIQKLAAEYPDVQLQNVALGSYIRGIRKKAKDYGLRNLKEPCFQGGVVRGSNSSVIRFFQSETKDLVCDNPREYLFWDKAHPTTKVHCLAATQVLDQLDASGIVRGFDSGSAENRCRAMGST